MSKELGIEVDTIRTIINEMHFMVEHEYTISHKDKNRYIAIIEALEKQVPKKMENYYCPICRHYFEDGETHNYCPSCGQKLTINY